VSKNGSGDNSSGGCGGCDGLGASETVRGPGMCCGRLC
jgi:hypothetical protein